MEQWVYFFGAGKAEGRDLGKQILGGKGANLVEMAHMGIPVPPGFVITASACNYFSEKNCPSFDAREEYEWISEFK